MKRILSIILAAVMLAVSLTALASCSNSVDASKDVENIKKAGVLKVHTPPTTGLRQMQITML